MPASDVSKPLGPTGSGDDRWQLPRHGQRGEAVETSWSAPGSRCRCVRARTPKQANLCRYGSLHAAFAISRRLASADGSERGRVPARTLVGRLTTANAVNQLDRDGWQRVGRVRSVRRCVWPDVDAPTRQPGCEPGILALPTDGQ